MAERLRCPQNIEPKATARLVGVLESTPTLGDGKEPICRAEIRVGDASFTVVARGTTRQQLSCTRPGDCLVVTGDIKLHDNVVAGKKQKIVTIEAEDVVIEHHAKRNLI